jgi:flagellar basal body-associated protein FliL
MDGNRSRWVALAVLAVLMVMLVAAAAAPLFEQQETAGGPLPVEPSQDAETGENDVDVPIPPDGLLLAVFVFVAIAFVAQFVADPWETLKSATIFLMIAGGIIMLAYAALQFVSTSSLEPEQSGEQNGSPQLVDPPNGSLGPGEGSGDPLVLPDDPLALSDQNVAVIVLIVVVLGAAVLLAATLLVGRTGSIQSILGLNDEEGDAEEPQSDLGAVGRVAGDAADDVEAASTTEAADNVIYRAWSEMVALLDAPDPRSGTPRDFATAAIDAGMNPQQVDVLTRTFEEVRYGDAALSEERRERAIEALRRIEDTHGDGETDGFATSNRDRSDWGAGEGPRGGDHR